MHKIWKKQSVSFRKKNTFTVQHVSQIYPALHRSVHRCLSSSRWHRTSLSINLSFSVQHQQALKKSVLAVLIVCAELGLPASIDGCPDSTQHATSETVILDRFKYRHQEAHCIFSTPPSEGNPFLHFCKDWRCEGDAWRLLTLFHSTLSHPWRPCRGDSPRWTHERATRKHRSHRCGLDSG